MILFIKLCDISKQACACIFQLYYKALYTLKTECTVVILMIKLLPVSVVAILSITSKFIKLTNGQKIITGDNIKFNDCSKYTCICITSRF